MMRVILPAIMLWILFVNSNSSGLCNNTERDRMKDTTSEKIIIDSDYNLDEALKGITIPPEIKRNLVLINVQYYSFDNKLHQGQLVVHKLVSEDLIGIFRIIKDKKFPVEKVIPIVHYNWDDEKSMEDNNTSAFNYRFIAGTKKLSNHSYGTAIDINPLYNPYIRKDLHQPVGSVYNPKKKGTLTENSFLVKAFKSSGWQWGGDWKDRKDYQHFEKPIE